MVQSITKGSKSAQITIQARKGLADINVGDSICTNGVCLTVTKYTENAFTVDIMAETMRKSNLNTLKSGSIVNLERALRVGDRLGGHFVSGHIDGTGIIQKIQTEENAVWLSISTPENILKYIIDKGSIAIDGISLTIAYIDSDIFKVSIIPHTKNITTLLTKSLGDRVNLECDLIGKYVEKLIRFEQKKESKKDINMDFLRSNGFV